MPPNLADRVAARLEEFTADRTLERIWAHDHTVWKPDPTEITNRLGWLNVAPELKAEVAQLEAFADAAAADGFSHAILLGMGGSSLGPEVIRETFGKGSIDLVVLDSTHPDQVRQAEAAVDLARTLFIVASKSGTTIETTCQMDYFWARASNSSQFVAITDPGSSLATRAAATGFRKVFENRPDIGGRYSVLSHFGMVPAAVCGAPIGQILADGIAMGERCAPTVSANDNPGATLGAWLGEAARAGRDKCTLVLPAAFTTLGWWIEQLVAESTGKEGRGILPVEGEALAEPGAYSTDRIFVAYEDSEALRRIEAAGHPVVRLDAAGLGGEFFRWEFATAVAGAILGVQPFDQPNVQEAKDAASIILSGRTPEVSPLPLEALLHRIEPGDYVGINAFVPRNAETVQKLEEIRRRLFRHLNVAVTVGFGPRFLHSTGQLHKGGPASGAFIEVVEPPTVDLAIPGRDYTFGELLNAQALGDLAALLGRGRRAARVHLDELEAAAAGW